MTTPSHIVDGRGTKSKAKVTSIGQLVTAPLAYDDTKFLELAEDDTAYNFYPPKVGEQFVITGIHAYADRQVSTNAGATVVVYEGTSAATISVSRTIYQIEMEQFANIDLALNILVNEGLFVNAKTTDDDIHMTITGYYIPKL